MNWTKDQQSAILSRGENLLLSAAAGSGKTAVLVERVIRLLEEGADVDRMLIVTFTRAAAADMRQKLFKRLRQAAQENPRFREQLTRLERAQISTLHAFCAELIKEHFQAAGVDPGFRLLDDGERVNLLTQCLSETLEAAYEAPSDGLEALSFGRTPAQISDMVRQLSGFLSARPDPEAWLERALSLSEGGGEIWTDELLREARRLIFQAIAHTQALLDTAPGEYLGVLNQDLAKMESLGALPYGELSARAATLDFARIPRVKEKTEAHEAAHAARNQTIKRLKDGLKKLLPDPERGLLDAKESVPELRALGELYRDLQGRMAHRKAARGALDFNDLEHLALKALRDGATAQAVREKFDHIFVDEYQDTSDLQESILSLICREDNRFMVGDVKQSIYRFRLAEPGLFLEKYAAYQAGQSRGRLIALSQNFRSRREILEFTNGVFARCMTAGLAEIDYDENAYLRPGAGYPEGVHPVELCLMPKEGEIPEGNGPMDEAAQAILDMTDAQREAQLAAQYIREHLDQPFYDLKRGETRPLKPRDFCILSRVGSGVLPIVLETLLKEGIPAYAEADSGYFEVLEVQVMLSLLELLDNGRRDLPLLSVLRSPIVGLDSPELAAIRAHAPKTPFCDAAASYAREKGDETALKLRGFFEKMARWRLLARALPLGRLVDVLLQESGYLSFVGALPGGGKRQANLALLSSRAQAMDSQNSFGLSGFVRYIRELTTVGQDAGTAHTLGAGDDVVRIMSIHKSKGLEFPVVIALMMGRKFRAPSGKGALSLHRDLGMSLMHHDARLSSRREPLSRRAILTRLARESMSEELRVLYVACTRAMNRLVLMGSVPGRPWALDRARSLGPGEYNCFLDVILPAALDMPGGDSLINPRPPRAGDLVSVQFAGARVAPAPQEQAEQEVDIQDVVQALLSGERDGLNPEPAERRLFWRYPYAQAVSSPLKLTASGLNREIQGPDEMPEPVARPSFMEEEALTGAEAGTAIHAALQAMALDPLRGLSGAALRAEIAGQLADMERSGILTPVMARAVDARLLAGFYESPLGGRMLSSPVVRREWPFNLRMSVQEALGLNSQERLLVQGVVDLCFLEGEEWVLCDYKTDRARDEEALLEHYRPQLALYARALYEITGKKVKQKVLCLLRRGRYLEI